MEKIFIIVAILLLAFSTYGQNIYNSTWVVKKQSFYINGEELPVFERGSSSNILDLSNISFVYSINGIYTGTNAFGNAMDGIFSLNANQIIMDGYVNDFEFIDADNFKVSIQTNVLDADAVLHPALSVSIYTKNSTLPISLINFDGKYFNDEVQLVWRTASEINNAYFQIEHSKNGTDFLAIGKVTGSGTTYDTKNYLFIHKQPQRGVNYYRLKQIDFDGKYEYSRVVSMVIENDEIDIHPNPTNGIIEFRGETGEDYKLKITDLAGKFIRTERLKNNSIDIADLPDGMYFISIQSNNQIITRRIIKN